jgi:hypothetical protein
MRPIYGVHDLKAFGIHLSILLQAFATLRPDGAVRVKPAGAKRRV